MNEFNLLIPGPTPLPPEVLEAMGKPVINHRGETFSRMLSTVLGGLQQIYQTKSSVLPFSASGTGGLEAAIVNILSPGDRVLAVGCGAFGDRFAGIAAAFGAEVIRVEAEWGSANNPAAVREALQRHPEVKAVLITHNETSTGVTNPLQALAEAARSSMALLVVDAVSSLGAIDLQMDAWGLDIVISGSQKALMAPPGMVFIAVSPRGWEAVPSARMPKHYFSFAQARDHLKAGATFTPFTPALPVLYALEVSIPMILREGLPARFARHRRLARATREGVAALGLAVLPKAEFASETVTAVRMPSGMDVKGLLRYLEREDNVILQGGQGRLEGKIIRIGHMGYVQQHQIVDALAALERALPRFGHPVTPGAGVEAAGQVLAPP